MGKTPLFLKNSYRKNTIFKLAQTLQRGGKLHVLLNGKLFRKVLGGWRIVADVFARFSGISHHFSASICDFPPILRSDLNYSSSFTSIIVVWIFFFHPSLVKKTQNAEITVKTPVLWNLRYKRTYSFYWGIQANKRFFIIFKILYPM